MNNSNLPIFGILSVALTPFTVLCAILAVVMIESFVDKPGSVSLSTLLPGIGHATSKVIFVCVAESVIAAVIAENCRCRQNPLRRIASGDSRL